MMRTLILVLTPDKSVSQSIGIKKEALIPKDIRKKYPQLSIASLHVSNQTTAIDNTLRYFRAMSSDVTGIMVLCDNRLTDLGAAITTPLFTVWYDHSSVRKNLNNYFGMIIGKVVRCFNALAYHFDNEKSRKLLILPLRNFRAKELYQLHLLFKGGVTPRGSFSTSLDKLLVSLRSRQTPKVETPYKTTFIVDDEDRYYEYGKEKHSRRDDKIPPHTDLCDVAGHYRFGKRYDPERHYNVSVESGAISGAFDDCHDTPTSIAGCSHINMFPNDFMA